MATQINMQYNPYLPRLTLLIDGKQPSEYSRLTQFADEDIWKWHSEILNVLYNEVRDEFFVIFTGTEWSIDIMKFECEQNLHCIGFSSELPPVNIPFQKRLGMLNQLVKNNTEIRFQSTIIESDFVIFPEFQSYLEEIKNIEISNLFCSTRVQILDRSNNCFENKQNTFLFILVKNLSEGEAAARKYNSDNPVFLIYQGTETKLKKIDNTYLAYECETPEVISVILNCFLSFPLMLAFRNCIQSISCGTEINFSKLTAIEPVVSVKIQKTIETGKSNIIQIAVDPPLSSPPQVIFRVLDNTIATTDNLCVFGVKPGRTQLEAYYYGTKKPFQVCEINVIQRNRIKKIILNDDELILGAGDTRRLQYDYSPVNADNVNTITWKSSDETIASVNSHGTLTCNSPGKCKIWCIAENVSTVCDCEVRPYLESLSVDLEEDQLHLQPMQEYEVNVEVYPENSIDSDYIMTSSDYNIANIIGNKVVAKNTGTATIEVVNVTRRKKTAFTVKVQKSSLIRKLFGR